MRRIRNWILQMFLPTWAKDSIYKENAQLRAKIASLEAEKRELEAYIDGVGDALRVLRRGINIRNEVSANEHPVSTEDSVRV